jgi:NAD/NADP transhydrogenase alpha subunit
MDSCIRLFTKNSNLFENSTIIVIQNIKILVSFINNKLTSYVGFSYKKKILTIFTIFFVLFTNQAMAHTYLKSSTPNEGEVITAAFTDVTIFFETKVEQTSNWRFLTQMGSC